MLWSEFIKPFDAELTQDRQKFGPFTRNELHSRPAIVRLQEFIDTFSIQEELFGLEVLHNQIPHFHTWQSWDSTNRIYHSSILITPKTTLHQVMGLLHLTKLSATNSGEELKISVSSFNTRDYQALELTLTYSKILTPHLSKVATTFPKSYLNQKSKDLITLENPRYLTWFLNTTEFSEARAFQLGFMGQEYFEVKGPGSDLKMFVLGKLARKHKRIKQAILEGTLNLLNQTLKGMKKKERESDITISTQISQINTLLNQ